MGSNDIYSDQHLITSKANHSKLGLTMVKHSLQWAPEPTDVPEPSAHMPAVSEHDKPLEN